jgi:arsenite-transporting ATPase
VLLFTGKGGVGKTTLAAATGVRLAGLGHKTLVVSTDPAHSVGDAVGQRLGGTPVEIAPGLSAAQLDIRELVDGAWPALQQHLRTMLAGAGVDELDAAELTVLPGLEDLLALGAVHRLAKDGPWDTVVVDCGPTAETLRLLAFPESLAGYLERLFPTHRRIVRGMLAGLAGSQAVDRWDAAAQALSRLAAHLQELRGLLTDGATTSVRLVLTPERVVAAEARRTLTALALQGIRVDGVLANRLVPAPRSKAADPALAWLRTRHDEQQAVLAAVRRDTALPVWTVGHQAAEPVGVAALGSLGAELYGDTDPLVGADLPVTPLLEVSSHRAGKGLDAEYSLRITLPLAEDTELALTRVADDLAVTVDGRRRLVALPPVLRRCEVTGADMDHGGVLVRFRPDPAVWMKS